MNATSKLVLANATALSLVGMASAGTTWTNSTATTPPTSAQDWTIGANWGGSTPNTTDSVVINNGGVALVSSNLTIASVTVGSSATGGGIYIQDGGTLNVTNTGQNVFRLFNTGPAAGTVTALGKLSVAGGLTVGATNSATPAACTFTSEGTVSAVNVVVAKQGIYNMTGGSLSPTQTYSTIAMGSSSATSATEGRFNQSGGTVSNSAGSLQLMAGGTYQISGGTFSMGAATNGLYFSNSYNGLGGTLKVVGSAAADITFGGLRYFATGDADAAKWSFVLDNGASHITKVNFSGNGNAGGNLRRGTLEVGLRGGVLLSGTDSFDLIEAPSISSGTNFVTGPGPLWAASLVDSTRDSVRVTLAGAAKGTGALNPSSNQAASFAPAGYGYVDLAGVTGNSLPLYLDIVGGDLSKFTAALTEAGLTYTTSNLPAGYEIGLTNLNPGVSGGTKFAWDLSGVDATMQVQGVHIGQVPEPTTVSLLAVSASGMLIRRQRR